jgi:hypothetical protein
MNPFFGKGKRRATMSEILKALQDVIDATATHGFAQMLELGDALINTDRISGYAEQHDRREWLLPLSARKGMTWQTESVPEDSVGAVVFLFNIGFGNGNSLPQPTGAWQLLVNGRPAVRIRNVNHSQLWQADECSFAFAANRIESALPYSSLCLSSIIKDESTAAFGPAMLKVPTDWLTKGKAATISVEPIADVPSTRWIQIGSCAHITQSTDIWTAADILDRNAHPKIRNYHLFFGDIHTHSGQILDTCENKGCGTGSRIENYEYAREPGALDFYALTDHEWQIDPDKTDEYLGMADSYNEDGRFVCLPGFEYTNPLYGHRNVYFRDSGGSVFNTNSEWGRPTLDPSKCNAPSDLWNAMEKTGVPFITVPHHPSAASHPLNLDFYNPQYDRLYEIYSSWGSSEYYGDFPRGVSDRLRNQHFHDAMRRGQRYGVIASSDGHDGHPGNAQSPLIKHPHVFHFCGSGQAVVLAPELTRAAVYDALHARRCYATTGTPIILDCRIGDALMGCEIPVLLSGRVPQIKITCTGTNGLDHIRIVKNGQIVHTVPCHGQRSIEEEWEDRLYDPGSPASYYARVVQVDRESAWSSPIWIG